MLDGYALGSIVRQGNQNLEGKSPESEVKKTGERVSILSVLDIGRTVSVGTSGGWVVGASRERML